MGCIKLKLKELNDSAQHFLSAIEYNDNYDCDEFPDIY